MKRKLLLSLLALSFFGIAQAQQVVSIVGTGVNGWPGTMTGSEMDMMTTDFITYTLTNVTVNTGEVKFRYNHDWVTNWGSASFPTGTGTQGGANIPTTAGTYNITFNRTTGVYSFIGASAFPGIGIWGPAVDSQNGFGGADVNMSSTDGVVYKLSAFNFSSGDAVFRQDDNPLMTFGSVSFPSGTAVAGGPNILVTGGQYSVTFNKTTGAYSFYYPSVGIMGTYNNWNDPDMDMTTTNGETYTLENFNMPADGFVKLRLDDQWTMNWGGDAFPDGTLVFNGPDMPVTAGTYNVNFNRSSLAITFTPSLGLNESTVVKVKVYPNPASNSWTIVSGKMIEDIKICDVLGKTVLSLNPGTTEVSIDASGLTTGVYFAKITSGGAMQNLKLIKE